MTTVRGDSVPVELIYIGGWGRSGSTLLSLILGGLPGFFPVGEARYIWSGGVADDELCSCGMPFSMCPFWTDVGDRAFGGWNQVDIEEMLDLERAIFGRKRVALLAAPGLWPAQKRRIARYAAQVERLYGAIRDVSGCTYLVDSTKDPPYAFFLHRIPGVRFHLVHLVRDSRAAAFAWAKQVKRPEVTGREAYFPRYGLAASAILWTGGNLVLHLLRPKTQRYLMRYESLADSPGPETEALLRAVGCSPDGYDLSTLERGEVCTGSGHMLRGNPMRFETGRRAIRLDEEWRQSMPPLRRMGATLLTFPLLAHYGYCGRGFGRLGRRTGERVRGRRGRKTLRTFSRTLRKANEERPPGRCSSSCDVTIVGAGPVRRGRRPPARAAIDGNA